MTLRAHTHTHTHRADSCTDTHTHGPSKVMVCVQWQAGRVLSCLPAITILLLQMERAGEYCSTPLVCCRCPLVPHTGGDDRSRRQHRTRLGFRLLTRNPRHSGFLLPRRENGSYFQQWSRFVSTKMDAGDHYQGLSGRQLYHLLEKRAIQLQIFTPSIIE